MTHIIAAVENALTAGRWRDAAPLLSDILQNGMTCELKSLDHYEQAAGRQCDDPRVRFHLTSRIRMVNDRTQSVGRCKYLQAEKLAQIVREHGHPCRVVERGSQLRVASQAVRNERWTWAIEQILADRDTVSAWLGY